MACNQVFRGIISLFLQIYLLLCWILSDILVTLRMLASAGQGLVSTTKDEMHSDEGGSLISWKGRLVERMSSLDRKYFVTITWCVLTFNFLIVFIQMYSAIMEGNPLYPINQYYAIPTTPQGKAKLFELTRDLVNAMEKNNITYFMYGGTLLGSWRHHGLVPWDDDVDFLVNNSQREQALHVLRSISERYTVNIRKKDNPPCLPLTKLYFDNEEKTVDPEKVWPFLDIFWFAENETHLWDCDPWFRRESVYLKSRVLPLERRPFSDLQLPAPCDSLDFLQKFYNPDICSAHHMSHISHRYRPYYQIRTVQCEKLYNYFPFVFRNDTPAGVNETLWIGEYRVQSQLIPHTPCNSRYRNQQLIAP